MCRMLSLAAASPRDFAVLQVFLQTGVRVSELCDLRLADLGLENGLIHVRGKGMAEREIDLEKKAIAAIRNWLAVRPEVGHDHLFLNRYGDPSASVEYAN
jgi:site-specific recombinase XerC